MIPEFLVSVRSPDEINAKWLSKVGIIDLKEPRHGGLSPVTVEKANRIVGAIRAIDRTARISMALGELNAFDVTLFRLHLENCNFAKIGLAGMRRRPNWCQMWRKQFLDQLPLGVQPVAVGYADYQACDAPEPEVVIQAASDCGVRYLLIDTFSKANGSSLEQLSLSRIIAIKEIAKRLGIRLAIAGSIGKKELPQLVNLWPDVIAVRGAVTSGSRGDAICTNRIVSFMELIQETFALNCSNQLGTSSIGNPTTVVANPSLRCNQSGPS